MTPKEFDKELNRLSRLISRAAYAGNVELMKQLWEEWAQVQVIWKTTKQKETVQ
jgi:hypothetical protein